MTYWFWRILLLQRHVADQTVKGRDPTLLSLLLVRVKSAKLHFLPFHMTRQLDCSCSWINEVITVQKEFVATVKCFVRNHTPSTFDLASRGFLIYPSQIPEICEGPWAFGKCACDNSSVHIQTTAALCLCSLWISVTAEETRSWTYVQSHTLLWTCSFSASTSNPSEVTRCFMDIYMFAPHPQPVNLKASSFICFHLTVAKMPASRNRSRKYSEFHEIKKNTENEILVVKYTSLQLF